MPLFVLKYWKPIAVGLFLLALASGSYFKGRADVTNERDAADLAAQVKQEQAARATEQDWQAKLNASQDALTKERQDALKRESTLRADIDTGARKLRIAISKQRVSSDPEGTSGSDDATAELSANSRSIYFRLRAAIIADTQTINACQGYVRAIGAG